VVTIGATDSVQTSKPVGYHVPATPRTSSDSIFRMVTARRALFSTVSNQPWYFSAGLRIRPSASYGGQALATDRAQQATPQWHAELKL